MADVVISVVQGAIRDPNFILKAVGAVLLETSQKAFREQRLGSIRWKRRYPSQRPPLINIAGSLQDFGKRASPKARRFVGRPVLADTGLLRLSLSPKKGGNINIKGRNVVEVGSTVPYASTMQNGGLSVQPVTSAQKKKMAKWMSKLRGARRKIATFDTSSKSWGPKKKGAKSKAKKSSKVSGKSKKKGTKSKAKSGTGGGGKYKNPTNTFKLGGAGFKKFTKVSVDIARAQKMAFLFNRTTLRTRVVARPFLGITPEAERKIREVVEKGMSRGRR
jgi:phage gpG-like protein